MMWHRGKLAGQFNCNSLNLGEQRAQPQQAIRKTGQVKSSNIAHFPDDLLGCLARGEECPPAGFWPAPGLGFSGL